MLSTAIRFSLRMVTTLRFSDIISGCALLSIIDCSSGDEDTMSMVDVARIFLRLNKYELTPRIFQLF